MAFNTAKGDPIIKEKKELQEPIIENSNPTLPSHQLSAVELAFLLNMISHNS